MDKGPLSGEDDCRDDLVLLDVSYERDIDPLDRGDPCSGS
jgi:hypothetical protein